MESSRRNDERKNKMKTNIREYAEGFDVEFLEKIGSNNIFCIVAKNEGGYNSTFVDLVDVINFVKENLPELL
jgi:hypothetical protein